LLWLRFPLDDAFVGEAYSNVLVKEISPPATIASPYTYGIDTLTNGSLPTTMTIDFGGTLSGTPFATGGADVNGLQIAHTYAFGVCATDTISRTSTTPCPKASVVVRPTRFTGSVVGSGGLSASPAGNSCGPGCIEGFALNTQVTFTATPATGWTFAGWSGACPAGVGTCKLAASGRQAVVATFIPIPVASSLTGTWAGTWHWAGPASNTCLVNDVGAMSLVLTQTGTSFSGTMNAAGIQFVEDGSCFLLDTLTSSGSFSGTVSGATVTYSFSLGGTILDFSGTATLNGSTLTSISLVRVTGGSGSFSLTKQ
jgi:hypothetical protein